MWYQKIRVFAIVCTGLFSCGRSTEQYGLVLVDFAKTYNNAKAFCQRFGYTLVRINNAQIFDEVKQRSPSIRFWIGMRLDTSQLPNYTYVYETMELANFTAWADTEPNFQYTDQCVRVEEGYFRTTECEKENFFICQRIRDKMTRVQTTTTISSVTDLSPIYHQRTTTHGMNTTSSEAPLTTLTVATTKPINGINLLFLEQRLKNIRKHLTINKTSLTMTQMRFISASDDRISSYSMGLVGVAIIIVVISMPIISDAMKILLWIKQK